MVSNEKEIWENKIDQGLCYIVVPGLQMAVGPMELSKFSAHMRGTCKDDKLTELEKAMDEHRTPPSFYL